MLSFSNSKIAAANLQNHRNSSEKLGDCVLLLPLFSSTHVNLQEN